MNRLIDSISRGRKNVLNFLPHQTERTVLLSTYLYLIFSLTMPNKRFFFILSFIYFVYLIYTTASVKKAIIYSFLPFWLLNVGREFLFVAVPQEAIKSPLYIEGRIINFVFSPFFILAITTISIVYATLFSSLIKIRNLTGSKLKDATSQLRIDKYILFFLLTFLLFFISSATSSYFTELSFLYTISEFSFFSWLFLGIITIRVSSRHEVRKLLTTLLFILFGMLVLEALIVYLQLFKRSTVGLTIEKVATIPSFGFGADENQLQFRPVGLRYHANALANKQISLLVTIILLWLMTKRSLSKKLANFIIVATIGLTGTVIIITQSRSAYLSLAIFSAILLIFNYKEVIKAFKFALVYLERLKIPILIVGLFFIFIILDRAFGSLFTLGETGGLNTRGDQIKEAIQLTRTSPILGVGNGMFISALYDFNPQGVVRFFPEYVHNGFILFFSERGILAAITYSIGVLYLFKLIRKSKFIKTTQLVITGGFVATYAMMAFQPFINIFSLNILIVGLLVEFQNHGKRV